MQRAHIGKDRKICIAPETGILLDTERPNRLVKESIELARKVIFPVDDAAQRKDLEAEFEAYWTEDDVTAAFSICDPTGASGQIVLAELGWAGKGRILLAPDLATARQWCAASRMVLAQPKSSYLMRLTSLFCPPRFDTRMSLNDLLRLVEVHASSESREALTTWLRESGLPSLVLLSAPLSDGSSDAVFAVQIPRLSGQAAKDAQRGFRPGHVPKGREVALGRPLPVRRIGVARGDQAFVLVRGGGEPSLLKRRVVVVGCGAVGSHVAASLAASGVGSLILIDPEELEPSNIHRHLLGATDLGRNKAEALAERVRERFPLASTQAVSKKIEEVLELTPEAVTGVDLVLIALGEETLELRLNEFLGGMVDRIHVWLEPLGLGGHVLATGIRGQAGCLACLYRRNDSGLPLNMAALAEPNQQFQRSLGGCRGTFTPYGVLDAQRAAIEAVRESIRLLTDAEAPPALTSWLVTPTAFVASGLKMSPRGQSIAPGTRISRQDFARPDCAVCAAKGT